MKKFVSLNEGNVLSSLLRFTFPIFLSLLLQTTYGTVDLLIVGQFSSIGNVSGVTIGSQVMTTITGLFSGLALGVTILIGKYLGENKKDSISIVIANSITIFTLCGLLCSLAISFSSPLITSLMQTPTESFNETKSYLFYCGLGSIFIVYYNLLGSIFRGLGDSKTPLITVAVACVVNIVLDLLFVAEFNMGAKGAAIATIIAQATSVISSLLLIKKQKLGLKLSKDKFKVLSESRSIFTLGSPAAVQSILVSSSFLIITAIINNFGVVPSAAVGIVEKACNLIMIVPFAFMQSLSAYTAQNFGARLFKRANKALFYSLIIGIIFGSIMAYLSVMHGHLIAKIFTSDEQTIAQAALYLKSYGYDTLLVAILFATNGYFSGAGKTTFVMLQSVIIAFVIRIPLAFLFSNLENATLYHIGFATPISSAFQVISCFIFFIYLQKKLKAKVIN